MCIRDRSTNSDRLERLEASVGPQEALLRALSRQVGQLPTQAQLEALARDVAQMRAELKQAGKKREFSVSPPSLETALSVLIWLALILLGTLVGMVVLRTIWSGLAALWSACLLYTSHLHHAGGYEVSGRPAPRGKVHQGGHGT